MKKIFFIPMIATIVLYSCERTHSCVGTIMDVDGNVYKVVEMNSRCWTAENLRTSTYANGEPIPLIVDPDEWISLESGAWAFYDNDSTYVDPYGKMYNWYAVDDSRGLCPAGWRVPTDEEWKSLVLYLGDNAGGKLKKEGQDYWQYPNQGATNETGFSKLPTGYRTRLGSFLLNQAYGYVWSSTEDSAHPERAWRRGMMFNSEQVVRFTSPKILGFSVRCIEE